MSLPDVSKIRVVRFLVFRIVFCASLFVLLFFFDLRLLMNPLVSLNFS